MADLNLVQADRIEIMDVATERSLHLTAGADIQAGNTIVPDANGRFVLADADVAGQNVYIAGKKTHLGKGVTGLKTCKVDGFDISALAIGAVVYASNTAGAISTAAGTNSLVLARVIPGPAFPKGGTVDKLLQFSIPV